MKNASAQRTYRLLDFDNPLAKPEIFYECATQAINGILLMDKSLFVVAFFSMAAPAMALDCSDLKPVPAKESDVSFVGKVDGAVDGIFAKLAGAKADVEGTYSKVAKDVLSNFPNADELYVWDRVIYLKCQIVSEDPALTTDQKLAIVGALYQKDRSKAPALLNQNPGYYINNSGDHTNLNQGNNNSIGK